jgi:hypothetical protein
VETKYPFPCGVAAIVAGEVEAVLRYLDSRFAEENVDAKAFK